MPLTSAAMAVCGCAGFHSMNDQDHLPQACLDTCRRLGIPPSKFILTVSVATQSVALFEDGTRAAKYPCSTSRFGIGQIEGSNCTPLGLHRIAEKIGGSELAGTVFQARKVVGHTSQPEFADAKITTRILWLEGLEPGLNRGANVDSRARYIYIHGTGDQESIGEPASHGCIHLADADLVPLYDLLPEGTLVWIAEQ
jgi:lipoprotein-anchoring transpeptidase ErfK/SrfK